LRRALALVAALVVLAGCGSSGKTDTQPLPVYRPNSNQTGDPGY
jgi:hypothetical protein